MVRIAIDAGHGPETAGKRSPDGSLREFQFNSAVAKRVIALLSEYDSVTTLAVYEDGRDVPLIDRTNRANAWKADVYVSIHADAAGPGGWYEANGITTFVYPSADAKTRQLAANVQSALVGRTGRRDRGVKEADLHVLRETKMTAILCECGFMTNAEECALLKTDAYRDKVAQAIVDGLVKTFALKRKVVETVPDVKKTADAATQEALKVLVANGIIQTPDYWIQNAYEGGVVRGDYAALMIQRFAKKFGPTTPVPTPPEPTPTPQPPTDKLEWSAVQKMTADASVAIEVGSGAKPGSGVLLADGYVLTAKHVGAGVKSIKVRTKLNGTFTATLVADHPNANVDLTLYRIDAKNLPCLSVSKSAVSSGQRLLAVVHADGFGTVKNGVVDRASISTSSPPMPWKFDCSVAAVNGDSGGPIADEYGQLAGIVVNSASVNVKVGSVWDNVDGCDAINVAHPVVSDWLKNYV